MNMHKILFFSSVITLSLFNIPTFGMDEEARLKNLLRQELEQGKYKQDIGYIIQEQVAEQLEEEKRKQEKETKSLKELLQEEKNKADQNAKDATSKFEEALRSSKEEAQKSAEQKEKEWQEKLEKEKHTHTYHSNINSTYGTCPQGISDAQAELLRAQAKNPKYNQNFVIAGAISDTLINKIAAPIFVNVASPAVNELWQKYIYQTESQRLDDETKRLSKDTAQLNKDRTENDNIHTKRMNAATEQNTQMQNYFLFCGRDSGNSNDPYCREIKDQLTKIYKKQVAEYYNASMDDSTAVKK